MPRQTWTLFWSKNDSNYLKVELNVFEKDGNKDFRLVQKLTMEREISTSSCD